MQNSNTFARPMLAAMFIAALAVMPLLGMAKEDKKDRKAKAEANVKVLVQADINKNAKDKNVVKKMNSESKASAKECLRNFGHLIAPGWLAKNERPSFEGCFLPFGIAKKLNVGLASTTDAVAPVIDLVRTEPRTTDAVIRWTTNERTEGTVYFGTTTAVAQIGGIESSGFTREHRLTLSGLAASTTYHAVIKAEDAAGNVAVSNAFTFTTGSARADGTAPLLSKIIAMVGTSTVSVSWKTDEPATSELYYAKNQASLDIAATTTAKSVDAGLRTEHSLTAGGLATGTPYRALIRSLDAAGNVSSSGEFTFTTGL